MLLSSWKPPSMITLEPQKNEIYNENKDGLLYLYNKIVILIMDENGKYLESKNNNQHQKQYTI